MAKLYPNKDIEHLNASHEIALLDPRYLLLRVTEHH